MGTWDDKRQIAIVWDIDDVIAKAKEREIVVTEEQAFEILTSMKSQHDCNYGITWETIDAHLDMMEK